ncbi:MAG: glycosyltransferase family 39 protein [Chloroflexota bacterium]
MNVYQTLLPSPKKIYHHLLLLIILLAFGIRLYNITYHSLWFDEAVSVYWANQTVPRILEVGFTLVEDRLPPLYYLMLKGWGDLFGFTEWSVRSLSVLLGILIIPATAAVARQLFNQQVALLTATLVALNPFLIWYAQEARMYTPATLFSVLTVWAFLQLYTAPPTGGGQPRLKPTFIFLFILFATAGLYSHLYSGFLLPALGVWLFINYPHQWQKWLVFGLSGVVITLLYAPIMLAIWRFSAESVPGDPLVGIGARLWGLLSAFTVWKAVLSSPLAWLIPAVIGGFAIVALLFKSQQAQENLHQLPFKYPGLLVLLLFLFPFLIANILLFRNHLAFFGERYFIVMTPWLLCLAAAGAVMGGTWLSKRLNISQSLQFSMALPALLLIVATLIPIPNQWQTPATKESWRQSVAYLAEYATPNHGILIHPDWVRFPFQFYFQGPGQTYAAFSTVTAETALDGPLQGVVGDHPVIWLIQSHLDQPDPDRRVEQWFATRYPLITELYPPGVTIKGYAPGYQSAALPETAIPVDITFENGLTLVGYEADKTVSATEDLFHPPSGWLHVTLYWQGKASVQNDTMPFVHLVGPEAKIIDA